MGEHGSHFSVGKKVIRDISIYDLSRIIFLFEILKDRMEC